MILNNLKTFIFLQARTGSLRFPEKVLTEVQGIPLLSHCIRRLKRIRKDIPVIVVTSDLDRDLPVKDLALMEGVQSFQGSEEDVLDRFYHAAHTFHADRIIRATGDNPLVDPIETLDVINLIENNDYDYCYGFSDPSCVQSLPVGVGTEAFTITALTSAWKNAHSPEHHEHINDYFFDHSEQFTIAHKPCRPQHTCHGLRLTVDTPEDLNFILSLSEHLKKPLIDLSLSEIVEFFVRSNDGTKK